MTVYELAYRNLDTLRYPNNPFMYCSTPSLTIQGRDDDNDKTGKKNVDLSVLLMTLS